MDSNLNMTDNALIQPKVLSLNATNNKDYTSKQDKIESSSSSSSSLYGKSNIKSISDLEAKNSAGE